MPLGEEEGAKFELRASLSDDLLHLVGTGVVNGIDLHFSPTLLPRSREDEEKLLHKWFTRIANGNHGILCLFIMLLHSELCSHDDG